MQTIHHQHHQHHQVPPQGSPAGDPWPLPTGAEPWCQVVEHADGFTVRFGGGDPAVLKACLQSFFGAVPAQRRRWNAPARTWWVDPAVERLLGSLSRWTVRCFAAHRVQRCRRPEATAAAWGSFPTGDDAAEGWVITQDPPPKPSPRPDPRPSTPPGWPWRRAPAAGPASPRPAGAPGAASAPGVAGAPGAAGAAGAAAAPGPSARTTSQTPPGAAPATACDQLADAYARLWLRPGAPWPVIRGAYRALAAVHHPDHGGDGATMKDLNAAYARLRHREHEPAVPPPPAPVAPASPTTPAAAPDEDDEDDGFSL